MALFDQKRNRLSLLILALLLPCLTTAQDDSQTVIVEPILNQIRLDAEGVTAVDTAGNELRYDFTEDGFVVNLTGSGENRTRVESTDGDHDEPSVEERCVRELEVDAWENTVRVAYDQYVEGDIISYGRVTVKGWVRGNVKSLNNRVLITGSGVVEGDVVAPDVVVKEGGLVKGRVDKTGNPLDLDDLAGSFQVDGVIVVASLTAFLLLAAFLVTSLMPRQLFNLQKCMGDHPARTFLLGFLLTLLIPLVLALVAITIIGTVLIPIIPLIYLAGYLLGFVAFGSWVTRKVLWRFGITSREFLPQSLIGISFLMLFWFAVALLLGMDSSTANGFGIFLLVFSILITTFPMATGLGAVVLTRFGFRPYTGQREREQPFAEAGAMPAPPPLPDDPPIADPPPDSIP
ncbi:MAG: polymer-forming cytoskeletal protein [bacterium]|nr:polymer-forming cytoskeletal protein [bacterium]